MRNRLSNKKARQLVAAKAFLRKLAKKKSGSKLTLVPSVEPPRPGAPNAPSTAEDIEEEDDTEEKTYLRAEEAFVTIEGEESFEETSPGLLATDVAEFAALEAGHGTPRAPEAHLDEEDPDDVFVRE